MSMSPTAEPRVWSRRKGAPTPPAGAVYVGRPTVYGNPFLVGRDGTRAEVIALYRRWINEPEQARLRKMVTQALRNKDLVCWCAPDPCHADVLLEIANE